MFLFSLVFPTFKKLMQSLDHMSLTCLDNAINLLLYVYSNLSIFFQYFLLCFQIYIFLLFFEDLTFRKSFDKTGSAL